MSAPEPRRSLDENLANLFREILLDMSAKPAAAIAVSGFTMNKEKQPQLVSLLNEKGLVELTKVRNLQVVEREKLDAVMKEQELSLSDLMDTTKAISVGRLLSARYILTGTVIEMPSSLDIFARIVNVETGEVESAAQVVVPKSREVSALL
jgi:curli biogenesis system outer membrane secretion channel CsgG